MEQRFFDDSPGLAAEVGTVRIERLLPGPIERVWAYLTESDKRAKWLAAGEMAPHAGGAVELVFRHHELSHEPTPERWCRVDGHVLHGRITRFEPPRLLSFTWPLDGDAESEVTFALAPQDDTVMLLVTHRRLRDRADTANVASGWHAHLGVLVDHLSGRVPRGFWSAHAAAEEAYQPRFMVSD